MDKLIKQLKILELCKDLGMDEFQTNIINQLLTEFVDTK